MVLHDGFLEAAVAGSLYGFHCAVHEYNTRSPDPPDYVTLVHRTGKITEYGIALGATCPDYYMFYHTGDTVTQMQDPHNHVWVYFRTERSDRLYIDVGSLPFGMGLLLDIIPYLPEGTPESLMLSAAPRFGAPAGVLDRAEVAALDSVLVPGSGAGIRQGYLADRRRFPVSSLPAGADSDPESAVRSLLVQLREAREEPPRELTPQAPGSPYESTGTAAVRIPLRDDPLEDHVDAAMPFFECAFNNTYAVLEQGTYRRYPPSLDSARCMASWVNVGDLERRAAVAEARAQAARAADRGGSGGGSGGGAAGKIWSGVRSGRR